MSRDVLIVLGGVLLVAIGWALGFLHGFATEPPQAPRLTPPAEVPPPTSDARPQPAPDASPKPSAKTAPAAAEKPPAPAKTPDPAEERREVGRKMMAAGKKFHQCHDSRCPTGRRRAHDCHDLTCPTRPAKKEPS